jgi:hypothetical protein
MPLSDRLFRLGSTIAGYVRPNPAEPPRFRSVVVIRQELQSAESLGAIINQRPTGNDSTPVPPARPSQPSIEQRTASDTHVFFQKHLTTDRGPPRTGSEPLLKTTPKPRLKMNTGPGRPSSAEPCEA